jgi:transcriptional regulator with XRE-family HTH domain
MEAKKIPGLIERTGLTRQAVAESLGVSVAMLRKYEHGYAPMPDARLALLEKLAGGAGVSARSADAGKSTAAALADIPFAALVEEIARRTRSGQVKEAGRSGQGAGRPLRAVAFTDVPDD